MHEILNYLVHGVELTHAMVEDPVRRWTILFGVDLKVTVLT